MTQIGFSQVEDPDKRWEITVGQHKYVVTKRLHTETVSIYNCIRVLPNGEHGPSSGFYSERDFGPNDFPNLPQFGNVFIR